MKKIEQKEIDFAPNENTFGLKVFKETWENETGKTKTYWKYKLPDVVQIIGFTAEMKIIAIKEFQPGIGADYLHLVGETMEDGEDPLTTAERGLLEETGYQTGHLKLLTSVLENSGRSDRLIYLVLALNCSKVRKGEKEIKVELFEPIDFWTRLLQYFFIWPEKKHGGGNSLKLITLAFNYLGLITITKNEDKK